MGPRPRKNKTEGRRKLSGGVPRSKKTSSTIALLPDQGGKESRKKEKENEELFQRNQNSTCTENGRVQAYRYLNIYMN